MGEFEQFTESDKIGKGDLNLGGLITMQLYRIGSLGAEDIEVEDICFRRWANAILHLRNLLSFKWFNDDHYREMRDKIKEADGDVDNDFSIDEWHDYLQLLIIKADEYGLLPAEETRLRE